MKGAKIARAAIACALAVFPCGLAADVVVGSKKFTESVILGDLLGHWLTARGVAVEYRRELGGTRILWEALRRGDIDAYPEYTGTLRFEILRDGEIDDEDLAAALARYGVGVTPSLGFENTYALGMRRIRAEELGVRRISDLIGRRGLRYGLSHEFLERRDGWPGLRAHYGLPGGALRGVDHEIGYRGLVSGATDVIDLYTTDAEIEQYDLLALEDDRRYFPAYQAVYLYRLDAFRTTGAPLFDLAGRIDERAMIRMNSAVQLRRASASAVAAQFLQQTTGVRAVGEESDLFQVIRERTVEHLLLVGVSLLLAALVGAPLGYFASEYSRAGAVILAVTGLVQTVPSLALLVMLLPLFGIGAAPALVALFLYSLLPIVRGTLLGFSTIPAWVRESAESLGLSAGFQFRHVYAPLALRSVLSGVKTAAVINVGVATLGALIGAGGYGQAILKGIRLDDTSLILAGAIPAALLALALQLAFDALERKLVSRGLRES